MKLLIAGGGTGGHLYPGIAIARELLKESNNEVLFVGTEQGIEARVLPKEGLRLRCIHVGKLKGMKLLSIVKTMIALPLAIGESMRLLREEKPDVVLGVGGYASGPIGIASAILRVPLIIVEPNSYAGLANRILGKLAKSVVLCFPGTGAKRFFTATKTALLGPLVRKGIEAGDRSAALTEFGLDSARFTVFVMGGSGGAHAINMAMKEAAFYLKDAPNLQVLHQVGPRDAEEVAKGYRDAGVKANVLPYIDNMAGAYAVADLVISRSGATTVAELAVCAKQAVLIPFPFAADNHQEYNARTLAQFGAADVLLQKEMTAAKVAELIKNAMSRKQNRVAQPNTAANEIMRICKNHVQKN